VFPYVLGAVLTPTEYGTLCRLTAEAAETSGLPFFASSKKAEQIVVNEGAERFRAIAVIAQGVAREDARPLQTDERGKSNAIAAVELAKGVKQFGFQLRVRALARGLRQGNRAFTFNNSHIASI
jgi:hypothetical protein